MTSSKALPRHHDTVLLSGATGFLGMELLARLLDSTDSRVLALVRASSSDEADSRVHSLLSDLFREPERYSDRVVALRGDLTTPGLGFDDETRALALEAGEIIHGAASVSFDMPLEESRTINVDGTRRMLELAEDSARDGALERFTYVSTAYVAGDCGGRVYEQELPGPRRSRRRGPRLRDGFHLHGERRYRNAYEQSKSEAESLVQARRERLPITILRPSIVVGDRTTGWTSSFNVIYSPMRAFASGAFSVLPARRRSQVDVVSVDYVAQAVLALTTEPRALGRTFHIVAGDVANTVDELIDVAARRFEQDPPTCVPPKIYDAVLHPLVLRRSSNTGRRLVRRNEVYFPYFGMRMRFDDTEARELLDPLGIRPSAMVDYFDELVEFAQAARWGREQIGRAEAQELCGKAPAQTETAQADLRIPAGVRARAAEG